MENHTWNGAEAGNVLLLKIIFSVQWTQILCLKRLIIAKGTSGDFYGISTKKKEKKKCVYIPHSGSLNGRCCIPHSSAPALTIPIVQHTRIE